MMNRGDEQGDDAEATMERLQKILSRAGIASRRHAERLMLEGRVTVNGIPALALGTKADRARDDIRVDGRRVTRPERQRYILLNKPRGFVSTRSDPERRPTIMNLLGGVHEYVYPVGRLDYDSEGLLLLTNDGELAERLTHPRYGLPRVYEVRVAGIPDARDLERLARGVVLDGRCTRPADVLLVGRQRRRGLSQRSSPTERRGSFSSGFTGTGPHVRDLRSQASTLLHARRLRHPSSRQQAVRAAAQATHPPLAAPRPPSAGSQESEAILRITIREGRHRQVRRMCEAVGHPVKYLRRTALGPIVDPHLKPGRWRELTQEEVSRLRQAVAEPS